MARHIHDDRAGQNQHILYVVANLDTIRIRPTEPALRDGRHRLAVASETVFVVGEISLCSKIIRPRYIDGENALKEGEKRLLDDGRKLACLIDLVSRPPREDLLADVRQFLPLQILERKLTSAPLLTRPPVGRNVKLRRLVLTRWNMSRIGWVSSGVLSSLLFFAVEASAGGPKPVPAPASTVPVHNSRSYSQTPQIDRRSDQRRAPYTVQSNIWRGDRKMFQTYWDRQPWRP